MENFQIKIAENIDELFEAARIVYTQYLKEGYISENRYSIWMTHFQLFEDSVVFIGKTDKVLCTASIVFNTYHSIPSKFIFPQEIAELEKTDKLCEITCLANIGTIDCLLQLFVQIYKYIKNRDVDKIVIETNPRRVNGFKLFGFEVISEKNNFEYMNVPVVLLTVNVDSIEHRLHPKLRKYLYE